MHNEQQKTAGVIGGMGPEATVDFMSRVLALTPAKADQDHVRMIVHNNPQVPDRQVDTPEQHTAVMAALAVMASDLEQIGADFLVMPCNTAHGFLDEVCATSGIPFISIIDETVTAVRLAKSDATRVGLLATDVCLASDLYQRALGAADLTVLLPSPIGQSTIMELVFRIKAGEQGPDVVAAMHRQADELIRQGAEVVIAGCTEIPLVIIPEDLAVPYLSSTAVLAQRTVDLCTGKSPLPAT